MIKQTLLAPKPKIGTSSSSSSSHLHAQQGLSHATTMMLYRNTTDPEITPVQQSFYPVLPRDTVIQFRICEDAKLHIAIYNIHFVSAAVASNRGDLQQPNKPWFVSSKHGEVALVTDQSSTTCALDHVSNAMVQMTAAFKQCVRLRDKLSIHRSYCFSM